MHTAVFVQVRMSSERLPGKALCKINGQPLTERLAERLVCGTTLPVFFITSDEASDDSLAGFLEGRGYGYYRGPLNNVLQRYIEAAHYFQVEGIIRVTGDNPLVSLEDLNNIASLCSGYDYIDNIHRDGTVQGGGCEFIRLHALEQIYDPLLYDQEHVTPWLRKNSQKFTTLRYVPDNFLRREDIFLTCDYEADLHLLKHIYNHFNGDNLVALRDVLAFLDRYPELKAINRHLHSLPEF